MITGIVVLLLARQARILEFPGFSADIIKRVRTMNIKEGASECNTVDSRYLELEGTL